VALAPHPVYARSGTGCRITDVEGEERVDFLNNYTSLILGHRHPEVTRAVERRAALGSAFSIPTPEEVELAELLTARVEYVEIRFCKSGSEAVMLAVKVARAFTGTRSRSSKARIIVRLCGSQRRFHAGRLERS
jgi:glutamate-1-semialdehyde 2,1-aminomutase